MIKDINNFWESAINDLLHCLWQDYETSIDQEVKKKILDLRSALLSFFLSIWSLDQQFSKYSNTTYTNEYLHRARLEYIQRWPSLQAPAQHNPLVLNDSGNVHKAAHRMIVMPPGSR